MTLFTENRFNTGQEKYINYISFLEKSLNWLCRCAVCREIISVSSYLNVGLIEWWTCLKLCIDIYFWLWYIWYNTIKIRMKTTHITQKLINNWDICNALVIANLKWHCFNVFNKFLLDQTINWWPLAHRQFPRVTSFGMKNIMLQQFSAEKF